MDGFALPQDMPVHDPDDPHSPPPLPFGPRDWPRDMSKEAFISFGETRPEKERWELWDGEPRLMNAPSLRQGYIGPRFAVRLEDHFEARGLPYLCATEVGLLMPERDDFLPVADVAVLHREALDRQFPGHYIDRFVLAAEIVPPSNTRGEIETKIARYSDHPECLYALTLEQHEPRVAIRARSDDWAERTVEGADAVLDLPAFDFSVSLADIYRRIIGA